MEKTWILVADEARARLFTVERPRGPLKEQADLVNPLERQPEHELGTDEPGRGSAGGPSGRHALEPRQDIREYYANKFAHDIAQRLKQARVTGQMERTYLVAAPQFLGTLRHELDRSTAACVVQTINKDLVGHRADDIRSHLPERLL